MKAPALRLDGPPADARCLIYTRVSTDDQAKDGLASLPEQERRCRDLAAERGLRVDHVWCDAGVSGRDESRLERLARWCEAHPRPRGARGLIVALKRDRWERFVHDDNASAFYEYRMARAGWEVDFALERKSGNRTTDAVTAVVHKRQAAEESEEKGRRAYLGMLERARQGDWQGRAPFAYARLALHPGTGQARTLAPFEHAAPGERVRLRLGDPRDVRTVRTIFRRFAEGATYAQIAEELARAGARGPFDTYHPRPARDGTRSARWRACTVRALLLNPVYVGRVVWNRRKNLGKTPRGKDLRERRPVAEWTEGATGAPPLVDRPTFEAAQRRLSRPGPRRRTENPQPYILTGLLTCATCGAPLVGGGGTRPKAHDPTRFQFYRCNGGLDDKHDTPRCGKPIFTVNQRWLEGEVIRRVERHAQVLVTSGALARALDQLLGAEDGRLPRGRLERERRDLEAQRTRIVERIARGILSDEDATATLGEIKAGLARVQRDLDALRLEPTRADRQAERERLLKLAADLPARLKAASPAAARELLGHWVTGIVLDKGRRTATLTVRRLPAAGSLSILSPAHQARERPCWPGVSPPSCRT